MSITMIINSFVKVPCVDIFEPPSCHHRINIKPEEKVKKRKIKRRHVMSHVDADHHSMKCTSSQFELATLNKRGRKKICIWLGISPKHCVIKK